MPVRDGTPVVLASASPRRRELLAAIGIDAEVRPADVDETIAPHEDPTAAVLRLAEAKAAAVAPTCSPDAVVLAADTIVVDGDRILGKPVDRADAEAMLASLSGRTHVVITGVCVRRADDVARVCVTTEVDVRTLESEEIAAYVSSGDADDKAGGYGIQGAAGAFVTGVRGSFSGVIGLPLSETVLALRRLGVDVVPHAVAGLGADVTNA